MKRSLVITGAVAVFAASTVVSIVVADSMQDQPTSQLPDRTAGLGAAAMTDPVVVDGAAVSNDDLSPDVLGAGYVSLLPTSADAAAAERALTPADAYPWPADGSDAGAGTSSGGSGASDSADVGAAMMGAPGSSGGYATRFIDLCAEVPDSTLCPTGVGGTVLVPFEGDVDFGTFDVFGIYGTPSPFWRCDLPASLETNEYPVLVNATHPARIEIEYHPVDDPTDSQHAVVDLTDLASEAYQEFSRYFGEHGTVPVEGVHHCFVLHASADFRSYEVTAVGTSFTGDTDTMVSRVDFNPRRPAVIVTPSTDDPLKATIGVPARLAITTRFEESS